MYQSLHNQDDVRELRFLHRILSHDSMPTLTYTADGMILFANDPMECLTGRSAESLAYLESWFPELFADQDADELRDFFFDTSSDARKRLFSITNGQGTTRSLELSILHIGDTEMEPSRDFFVLKSRDVTVERMRNGAITCADYEKSLVLDHLSEMVVFFDTNRNVQWANRRAIQYLGTESEPLIGKRCTELWCKDSRFCDICPINSAITGGGLTERELAFSDEQIVYMLAKPVLDDTGELTGVVQVVRDITESRLEHDALIAAERFSRGVIDALSAQIAVLDEHGAVIAVNRAWKEYAAENRAPGQDIGRGDNLFALCPWTDAQSTEIHAIFGRELQDVVSGRSDEFRHEFMCTTPDGERWFVGRITRFADDGPSRVVISRTDITARKRAEEQIADISRFPEENPNPVLRCDGEGRITYANRGSSAILKRWGCANGCRIPDQIFRLVRQVLKTNIPESAEIVIDGVYLSLFVSPAATSGNVIIYGVDISGQRQERRTFQKQQLYIRALMENTHDHIYFKDADSRFLMLNKTTASYIGASSPEAAVGTTDFDYFDKAEAELFLAKEQEIMRTGKPLLNHRQCDEKPGRPTTWLSISKHPMYDEKGAVVGTFGINRDITDLAGAEDALRKSELKYRRVLNNLPQKIFFKDRELRYVLSNQNYAKDLGILADDVIGKDDYEFFPKELAEKYRGDDRRLMDADLMEEINERYTADGKDFYIHTVKTPVHDTRGNVIGILGIFWDVTEQMLREFEVNRLIAALSQVHESITITDKSHNIVYVNPAFERITGYSHDDVIGSSAVVLNGGKDGDNTLQNIQRVLENGDVWMGTLFCTTKEGKYVEEEATISPVRNQCGEIVNYVAVKRNMRKQRLLEKQLNQNQKLESVGRLAAGIAHEINTPTQYVSDNLIFLRDSFHDILGIINAFESALPEIQNHEKLATISHGLQQMIKDADLSYLCEEIPNSLAQSEEGIRRVSSIVRAMKAFSHPGTDSKMAIDINNAIQSTITVARNEWKYVADVETDLAADLPPVFGFASELNQVILNIILNAAQAISEMIAAGGGVKGRIDVRTRQRDSSVEIRISDNGPGIPDEIRAYVFDPFFTTKEVGKGTGQGLAIAHDVIVNKHGGSIGFESGPEQGTAFIITLPVDVPKEDTR